MKVVIVAGCLQWTALCCHVLLSGILSIRYCIYSMCAVTCVHVVCGRDAVGNKREPRQGRAALTWWLQALTNNEKRFTRINHYCPVVSLTSQSPHEDNHHTVKEVWPYVCMYVYPSSTWHAVTFSHCCLLLKVILRCSPCQQRTWCAALHCADTFTCSQCYTFTPAGLAMTLLADDGAHCIPWSGPEVLFSTGRVWLEGRVF